VIVRRVLLALMAAATFSVATGVIVVALAFALYALLEPRLGRAGAAGAVALLTAVLIALAGMIMALAARGKRAKAAAISGGILERVIAFVRQKPIVAASAAIGAGLMAARNPKYLGEALRGFLDGEPRTKYRAPGRQPPTGAVARRGWKKSAWPMAAFTVAGSNGLVIRNAGSGRSPVSSRSGKAVMNITGILMSERMSFTASIPEEPSASWISASTRPGGLREADARASSRVVASPETAWPNSSTSA
jgi:hypothetical protein